MPDFLDPLLEPARLRAIDEILAAHSKGDIEFDRLTRLGARMLHVPICLVTLVTGDRQIFHGASGLPENLDAVREVPLSHSVCKHAVLTRNPLTIRDATEDPRVADSPAVTGLGLRAYLGFPLVNADGHTLGSFCAIDLVPREWNDEEIDIARDFAVLAVEQLECAVALERSRSAFDVVIHDVQSPLSGIVMASALIEEGRAEIPARFHPLLQMIGESSDRAQQLIRSLIQDDRGATVHFCDDPVAMIRLVCDRLQADADSKQITFLLDLGEPSPLSVPPWVLEQVIENLASNAIKFAPESSNVWLGFGIADGGAHLRIRDEGPGFTTADRKRMFKRYTRLSASPTGNEASTGLGLSIVKRLVDQNGGRIELVCEEGQSADFRISFALHDDPET